MKQPKPPSPSTEPGRFAVISACGYELGVTVRINESGIRVYHLTLLGTCQADQLLGTVTMTGDGETVLALLDEAADITLQPASEFEGAVIQAVEGISDLIDGASLLPGLGVRLVSDWDRQLNRLWGKAMAVAS